MLYTYAGPDPAEHAVLLRIAALRGLLRHDVATDTRRWTGLLARVTRARALRASNSIEGIHVSREDALATVDTEDTASADRPTRLAVQGFQSAMTYILQRCRTPELQFTDEFVLGIHYMITQSDLRANPGNWRPGWVGVRNTQTGGLVHEGVDRELLVPLIGELVATMNERSGEPMIRAALAHLNLAILHPFSDGNGRTARCLQTAVLARDGLAAPIFSSIEEYIGFNQARYYAVLGEVGGGRWAPTSSTQPWIRFCLLGHYREAQDLLRRVRQFDRLYQELQVLVGRAGIHERATLALLEAATGNRVRNASYRASAEISNTLATRDLKLLVDAGLLAAEGDKRGREYVAGPEVRRLAAATRVPRATDDPFNPGGVQTPLFA